MNESEFERRVLEIWLTTRIPLTHANLGFLLGVPRKKLEARLRDLCVHGVLEADSDDAGEMFYLVPGAQRPRSGPETPAELQKMKELKAQVTTAKAATALALRAPTALLSGPQDKSLVASGVLSFFFGPLGWLYAGSWKEAVPASAAYALAYLILPMFFFAPLAVILHPVAAAVGVGYAWRYNRSGGRQKLLPEPGDEKP